MERKPETKSEQDRTKTEKDKIRKHFLKLRGEICEDMRKDADAKIARRLFETEMYRKAKSVYCYAAFRDEAGTAEIMEESLRRGKRVAAPRVTGRRRMEFFYIRVLSDLKPGTWSIPEPGPWCDPAPKPDAGALVIMPGAAFDRNGNRIGYGGGYYDTYLADCPSCRRAALAFSVQCAECLPADPHDIRPEFIITEKELIICPQDCR